MHQIIITRKRMKSMRMSVEPSGVVKVSAPKRVSDAQIQRFVEERKSRIEKAQAFYETSKELLAVNEGEVLLHGVGYGIQHKGQTNSSTGDSSLRSEGQGGERDSSLHPKGLHKRLTGGYQVNHDNKTVYSKKDLTIPANLTAFYTAYAKEYLVIKLLEIAQTHRLTVAKVSIRGQKTKRGTCSSKKHISLNWKLVKMPHHIAEYVICHELAHLIHLNHSQAFWSEVERIYPDYKKAEQWIKKHGGVLQ